MGPVGGVAIKLTLVEPQGLLPVLEGEPFLFSTRGERTTTTLADGSYSFIVPNVPATYSLAEIGLDPKTWFIQYPPNGVYPTITPGATGKDFHNYQVPPNGVVMYLNKTVDPGCRGGYVVNGTTIEGEARNDNKVSFFLGEKIQTYNFQSNEKFRFTIWQDQYEGEFKIEHFNMTSLKFNVTFEVWDTSQGKWATPSRGQFNHDKVVVRGIPTGVYINAINKNLLNEESNLTYRHPVCSDNKTLLRLNGQVRINDPSDNTYLEFKDLHEVHDNRYNEGLNTLWIYLMPEYDYILAQGVCVYP